MIRLVAAIISLLVEITSACAGGYWQGLPASTSPGVQSGNADPIGLGATIPAAGCIPMDTAFAQGINPQTMCVSPNQLNVYNNAQNGRYYALAFGIKCDGKTDDSASINGAITSVNAAGGGTILFPAATCVIGATRILLASNVYLQGQGAGATILKAATATYTLDLIDGISLTNFGVSGFTIDYTNATPSGAPALIGFRSSTKWSFSNNSLISVKVFGVVANNGTTFRVYNNYCNFPSPVHTQNECFLFSIASGQNSQCALDHNTAIGSGVNVAGLCDVTNNYISGWGYGAGITVAQNVSTHNVLVADNYSANGIGPDVNNVRVQGLEIWAPGSIIRGNRFFNNCGNGADIGGQNSLVEENYSWDNGACGAGATTQDGFQARYQSAATDGNANQSNFTGNYAWDDGAGTQQYGFGDQNSSAAIYLNDNYLSGTLGGASILGTTVITTNNTPVFSYSAAGTALPTCNSGNGGLQAYVSDANGPTYLGAYSSGGAVKSRVLCNGTGWVTE